MESKNKRDKRLKMTREQIKSLFTIHTNGQDEWIRVDKRTYEKAIDKFCDDHIAELKEKDKKIKTAKKVAQDAYILGVSQAAEMDRFWAEFGLLDENISVDDAIAFFKTKDERIAELEAKLKNMCAKFADNAIKPSEMWKLHLALKDNE